MYDGSSPLNSPMTTTIGYSPNTSRITKDQFKILKVIGKGSYGKVFLVKKGSQVYAMKVLDKYFIAAKNLRIKT